MNCINSINKLTFSQFLHLNFTQNLLSLHYFPDVSRQNLLTAEKSRFSKCSYLGLSPYFAYILELIYLTYI